MRPRPRVDAGGLAALVPARPGPRRAHKLTDEVVAFARQLLEADPSLRSVDLADAIAERFGVRVHPRSVERALARIVSRRKRRRSDERVGDGADVERYEQLRRRALGGDAAGWRLGLAVLQRHGVAAWTRAWRSTTRAGAGSAASRGAGRRRRGRRCARHHGAGLSAGGVSGDERRRGRVSKVTAGHLARTAYLYVRQSTLRQVLNNTESTHPPIRAAPTGRRAGLAGRADRRRSTATRASPVPRPPTAKASSVSSPRSAWAAPGSCSGLEVSRLARNNADWHRLLEICALTDTLICDEDGLYDPAELQRPAAARA